MMITRSPIPIATTAVAKAAMDTMPANAIKVI